MRSFISFSAIGVLLFAFHSRDAAAADATVGVNVVGVEHMSESQQDALIERLQQEKVKTVRTGLGDKFTYFLTSAFRHGIGAVVIVSPTAGSAAATANARRADPPRTT